MVEELEEEEGGVSGGGCCAHKLGIMHRDLKVIKPEGTSLES